jgi:hypothetical protein
MGVAVVGVVLGYQFVVSSGDDAGVGCYALDGDTAKRSDLPPGLPAGLYPTPATDSRLSSTACTEAHRVEVVGYTDGQRDEAKCRAEAEAFLGGPLEGARVSMTFPHSSTDGVYPCALVEVGDTAGHALDRSASLRDGLRGAKPLAVTCVADAGRDVWRYTLCNTEHAGELVGVVDDRGQPEVSCATAADSYIKGFAGRKDFRLMWGPTGRAHLACYAVVTGGGNPLHASIKQ